MYNMHPQTIGALNNHGDIVPRSPRFHSLRGLCNVNKTRDSLWLYVFEQNQICVCISPSCACAMTVNANMLIRGRGTLRGGIMRRRIAPILTNPCT